MTGAEAGPVEPRLVTCIIVSWNAERYLGAAIESVLAQTYRPIDAIVVDAESSDDSLRIASSFPSPVRICSIPNLGPAANRNAGVSAARGEFVAFLDGDDLWHPDKLARHMSHFDERPQIDCSVTLIQNFWDEGHQLESDHYRDHRRMQPVAGYVMTASCARRSAFDRVGMLDESLFFSDSADWFIRAEQCGVVVELLPEVLTWHRLHGENLSRRRADDSTAEFARVLKRRLDHRRTAQQ